MVSKLTKKWKVSIQSFSYSDIFAKHAANTVLPESKIIYHQEIWGLTIKSVRNVLVTDFCC